MKLRVKALDSTSRPTHNNNTNRNSTRSYWVAASPWRKQLGTNTLVSTADSPHAVSGSWIPILAVLYFGKAFGFTEAGRCGRSLGCHQSPQPPSRALAAATVPRLKLGQGLIKMIPRQTLTLKNGILFVSFMLFFFSLFHRAFFFYFATQIFFLLRFS